MNSLGQGLFSSRTRSVRLALLVTALIVPVLGYIAMPSAHAVVFVASISDAASPEDNGTITFTVSLSEPAVVPMKVDYATSDRPSGPNRAKAATSAEGEQRDYQASSGTITFEAGRASETVSVPLFADATPEPNETFLVNLSNIRLAPVDPVEAPPAGLPNPLDELLIGDGEATGTIQNEDGLPATVSIGNKSQAEGDTATTDFGTQVITLSKPIDQPVTVTYRTSNGTATAGADYTATTSTAVVPAFATKADALVPVVGDTIAEPNETFTIALSNAENANLGAANSTQTILNDDGSPAISVAGPLGGVPEEDPPDVTTPIATFTVTLDKASSSSVTVDYATQDGTAKAPADYKAATGKLTFAPAETSKTVDVTVVSDNAAEIDETFKLVLSNATNSTIANGTATATIADDDRTTPTASIADAAVDEGTSATNSTLAFTVTLSSPSTDDVTVQYSTGPDTTANAKRATPVDSANPNQTDADYAPVTNGTITFPAGEVTAVANVSVVADANDDEPFETLQVTLSNFTGATAGDGTAIGTINDDDSTPTLSVVSPPAVTETDDGTNVISQPFQIVLSQISNREVKVNYASVDQTAANGEDYGAVAGQLVFRPGSRLPTTRACSAPATANGCVAVTVFGDDLSEANETLGFRLSTPVNATVDGSDGQLTVNDTPDPLPLVSVANAGDVTETNGTTATASFPVTLSEASGQVTEVTYATADGTAKQPGDYTETKGTLTFNAGETSKNVLVPITGDTVGELDESFTLTLSEPTKGLALGTPVTGSATIVNDDGAVPPPVVRIGSATVAEGDIGQTPATFTVTLDREPTAGETVTVRAGTVDGTATAASGDYQTTSATVTFSPGETSKPFAVPVNGDTNVESNETFTVMLTNPSGASVAGGGGSTGTGTINNDDDVPSLSINDVTVTEGNSGTTNAVLTVTRSGNTATVESTVEFETLAGSASTADFEANGGTLTFAAGDPSETITVPVTGDTVDEPDETFTVELKNASQATIADGSGLVTIKDNDDPGPAGSLSVADVTVGEAVGAATVTVTLSSPSASSVSVNYVTSNGNATEPADYTAASGTLIFAPNQTTRTFPVTIAGDTLDEYNEKFNVTLSGATGGATIADGSGVVNITDDDAAPSVAINDASVTEGDSGTKLITFTVTLSAKSGKYVTVQFGTANGTAVSGSDYVAKSGEVAFPAGQTSKTITVSVKGDTAVEPNETFRVNLTSPLNVVIADSQGIGTIVNND